MSATSALLIVLGVWLLIGVIAAVVMGRRGHHPFTWGALGAVLGPLVIPLAGQDLQRERDAPDVTLATGTQVEGGLAVLIGIDGSIEAHTAVDAIIDVVGERLGNCTLAHIVDFDTASSRATWPERENAERLLSQEAQHFRERTGREPAQMLLPGHPASALRRYAEESGCQLLVIGSRGRGASKLLLGSVASEIARRAPVPSFIVSTPTGDR